MVSADSGYPLYESIIFNAYWLYWGERGGCIHRVNNWEGEGRVYSPGEQLGGRTIGRERGEGVFTG